MQSLDLSPDIPEDAINRSCRLLSLEAEAVWGSFRGGGNLQPLKKGALRTLNLERVT